MKNLGTIFAAVFLAVVLVLYMCTYQVRYTEVAIEKTWGKANPQPIEEAGLQFKWPSPIQKVVRYDKRVRVLDDTTEETRTADGDNLILTTFTLWRIADAAKFHTNFPGGERDGIDRLQDIVRTHKNATTGQRTLSEFISTRPGDRKLEEIEAEMQALVAADAMREYGIEVVDFGIKKLGLPEAVTTAIFDKMKAREAAKADRYAAEGKAAAVDIVSRARAAEERIMAVAREKVVEIETEAERKISEHYRDFDRYPALRIFLDKLRTLRESLAQRTTLILDTTTPPYDLFDAQAREEIGKAGTVPMPEEVGMAPVTGDQATP